MSKIQCGIRWMFTFSRDRIEEALLLLLLWDRMDVFLPNDENNRPGLLFFNLCEVCDPPLADSEDETLLLSLNYTDS